MQESESVSMVYITAPNREEAISISRTLLHARLIACANIMDHVTSMYWWMGEIEHNPETIIVAKSRTALVAEIIAKVKAVHSYETPCIAAHPLPHVNAEYMQWVIHETTPK